MTHLLWSDIKRVVLRDQARDTGRILMPVELETMAAALTPADLIGLLAIESHERLRRSVSLGFDLRKLRTELAQVAEDVSARLREAVRDWRDEDCIPAPRKLVQACLEARDAVNRAAAEDLDEGEAYARLLTQQAATRAELYRELGCRLVMVRPSRTELIGDEAEQLLEAVREHLREPRDALAHHARVEGSLLRILALTRGPA